MKHAFAIIALFGSLFAVSPLTRAAEPIEVFILAGQSNMEGQAFVQADAKRNGGKGSLEFLVKDPATASRFAGLMDSNGKWVVRNDVWIKYQDRQGPLTVGYGVHPDRIGPELGFGWTIAEAVHHRPVLLIKCAWGGKSLAIDFRPPSSGKVPYPLNAKRQAELDHNPDMLGKYYRLTLSQVHDALAQVHQIIPNSEGRPVELAGFGWHQGWNDRIDNQFNSEYEKNMAHFIRDMRKDLNSPKLPFVIAETGMNGPDERNPRALSLMKAQGAVAEYPEFKGNVAFVRTQKFWRPVDVSPVNQGYHWNCNAETYYLIGCGMADAMKPMLSVAK